MYEFESRVRYSEVDSKGALKYSALVNYLQDCSTFQSEDLGLGVEYLKSKGLAWVLNYWQIDIVRRPVLAENIIIGTIPIEIKGFIGFRNFYIKDKETGTFLVKAYSVWTLIDLKTMRPTKADMSMLEGYVCGEKLDMEYLPRKIALGENYIEEAAITITEQMIDTNDHVNNEQYIELALLKAAKEKAIKRIRAEYKAPSFAGDSLIPRVYREEQGVSVAFMKDGTEPSMKCEFIYGE